MGTPDATRRQAESCPDCPAATLSGSPHDSGVSRRRMPESGAGVATLVPLGGQGREFRSAAERLARQWGDQGTFPYPPRDYSPPVPGL